MNCDVFFLKVTTLWILVSFNHWDSLISMLFRNSVLSSTLVSSFIFGWCFQVSFRATIVLALQKCLEKGGKIFVLIDPKPRSINLNLLAAFCNMQANEDCNCYSFDARKLNEAKCVHKDHVSAVWVIVHLVLFFHYFSAFL